MVEAEHQPVYRQEQIRIARPNRPSHVQEDTVKNTRIRKSVEMPIDMQATENELLQTLYSEWLSYNPMNASELGDIADAAGWMMQSLQGKNRESGDLSASSHPFEVAHILACAKLDRQTVIAGLLHDTVEDTKDPKSRAPVKITSDMIRQRFGERVALMVEDLSKVKGGNNQDLTPQNHLKIFEALLRDYRTTFVKLADRLHNMRTINGLTDPTKRRRKAEETLKIYAPLALHLGMKDWAEELMDLSFQTLYKRSYARIKESHRQILTDENLVRTRKLFKDIEFTEGMSHIRQRKNLVGIHIESPSLGYLYKENANSFPDISKDEIAPLVTIVVKKNTITNVPKGLMKKFHVKPEELTPDYRRFLEQEAWKSHVIGIFRNISDRAEFRGNNFMAVANLPFPTEKTPFFKGITYGHGLPIKVRFITDEAYKEEQASLIDESRNFPKEGYAQRKLNKLQHNIKTAVELAEKKRREINAFYDKKRSTLEHQIVSSPSERERKILREKQAKLKKERDHKLHTFDVRGIVEQITSNLDSELIYIKTVHGNIVAVQKGSLRDISWQLDPRIARQAIAAKITHSSLSDTDNTTNFFYQIEEEDSLEYLLDPQGRNMTEVSWLDEAETAYAKRKIAIELRAKIDEETNLPEKKRIVTLAAIERGKKEIKRLFAQYAIQQGSKKTFLLVGVSKARDAWKYHHPHRSHFGGDRTDFHPKDLLIHIGLEDVSVRGYGRSILKNTVAQLYEIQKTLTPIHLYAPDIEGSLKKITKYFADVLKINLVSEDGFTLQEEENAQDVIFMITKEHAQKLTPKVLENIRLKTGLLAIERGQSEADIEEQEKMKTSLPQNKS